MRNKLILPPSAHFSDARFTSNPASLPHHCTLIDSGCNTLHLCWLTVLLPFYTHRSLSLTLSVSLWAGFSVGTGYESAGSSWIVTDRLLVPLGDWVQRSCRPLLLAMYLKVSLGKGRRLRVGWRFGISLGGGGSRRRGMYLGILEGMGVRMSLRWNLGLDFGLIKRMRLWVELGWRLLLYLQWLVLRMVLQLWGSCSIFIEAAGLSCIVDLTQSVQCLALGMLQQVCLALTL